MPGRSKRSSTPSDDRDAQLVAVLEAARKALRRGDGWTIDQSHYDRLRADFEAIGFQCNEVSITVALRSALSEIKVLRRRTDTSYAGLADGQTLYDCRWASDYFKRTMYIKFAMNDELLELLTFHQHSE
jgi:hypothetical protein